MTLESHRLLREEEEGQVDLARSGKQVKFQKHDCAEAGGIPEPDRPGSRDVRAELVTRGGPFKGRGGEGKHECETARGVHWID